MAHFTNKVRGLGNSKPGSLGCRIDTPDPHEGSKGIDLPLRVVNRSRQAELVTAGQVAYTPWSRLIGLLGRPRLEPGEGLLLCGEKSIHTFGMRFPIDVVYVDRQARVLRAIGGLIPQRLGPFLWRSRDILELPAGTLAATGTREGDELLVGTIS